MGDSLRLNLRHQLHRSRDIDAVTFPAAHNGTANGIQLELPPRGNVLLHGAAHGRRRAVEERLDFLLVNPRAASVRYGTRFGDRRDRKSTRLNSSHLGISY